VATRELKLAERLLDMLIEFTPRFVAETRIVLARTLLMLDDVAGSREQLSAAGPALHRVPDAVVLKSWFQRTWDDGDTARSVTGRWPLTPAELRLLHYLPTHLTFREIAQELFVSTNTVKTQARSIYRKLDVSGRAEAVACAQSAGLLGAERER
jgi:LuxR family maltose regulon positive regulatory protein